VSVTVKFFASLREDLGRAELEVEADTIAALLTAIGTELGDAVQHLQQENVRIAVNQDLVDDPALALKPGDEVAFLPPVTGG